MRSLAVVALAYVLGSLPFGPLLARLRGVDLRQVGSGNVGATNVGRALGAPAGRLVLVLDAAKGAVAVLAARALHAPSEVVDGAAVAAVLGHCFSMFLRGRGGKGAATSLGVALVLEPYAGLAGGLAYVLAKRATRIASIGSLAGLASALVTSFVIDGTSSATLTLLAIGAIVVVRHRDNIRRLREGTERPT